MYDSVKIQDGDSNETCTAKYMFQIGHIWTLKPPDWQNKLEEALREGTICAGEVLNARE